MSEPKGQARIDVPKDQLPPEGKAAVTAAEVFAAMSRAYGDNVDFSAEFRDVLKLILDSSRTDAQKVGLKRLVAALRGETVQSADSNGDGQVSVDEARNRVAQLLREHVGEEQANLFLGRRSGTM